MDKTDKADKTGRSKSQNIDNKSDRTDKKYLTNKQSKQPTTQEWARNLY